MSAGDAAALFALTFGGAPTAIASAPGRVNLIGEHTDYSGGEVLPIAIGRRTWVAVGPGRSGECRAVSGTAPGAGTFRVADASPAGQWWDYVHGALRELERAGAALPPLDIAVSSTVPAGAGLSSSAALEVATILAALGAMPVEARPDVGDVALVAHRAEKGFVGVSCGIMDQSACAWGRAGHALRLWCDSGKREHVPFGRAVLVVDTATPRELRGSAFNARQASCARALAAVQAVHPAVVHLAHATPEQLASAPMSDEDGRRARHVIAETARVGALVDALHHGHALGTLLAASHASLRDDFECSSPELDWVIDTASGRPGIEGARLTGAGWGGCAIVIGDDDALAGLAEEIGAAFGARWGRAPRSWLTRAEDGGRLEASVV